MKTITYDQGLFTVFVGGLSLAMLFCCFAIYHTEQRGVVRGVNEVASGKSWIEYNSRGTPQWVDKK